MKKLLLSIALVLTATISFGQELSREEAREQRRQIRALMDVAEEAEANIPTDPVGAANAMRTVISSPLVNNDAYVWFVSASAKAAVIDVENRKRAEGAAFDEAMLYNYTFELGGDLANCEKYDNMPDNKGRVKPKYAEFILMTTAQQFAQFYNAGAYYYGNEEYEKAYELFGMFIAASNKLYEAQMIAKDTINVPVAAYNRVLCGMQLEDYAKVIESVDEAMVNPEIAPTAFRYKTMSHLELGDTAAWLADCKEGVMKFPTDAYFYQSLIQYYDNRNESEQLNALADELLATDPTNPLFVYLKGYIAHGNYERDNTQEAMIEEAITWYRKTLEIDPNYETALSNLGRCYLQKAQAYSNEQSSVKVNDRNKLAQDREILRGFYSEALPLYEKLRTLAPERTEYWLNGLMNCYYGLNMENELLELERLQESLYQE